MYTVELYEDPDQHPQWLVVSPEGKIVKRFQEGGVMGHWNAETMAREHAYQLNQGDFL